MSQPLEFPSRPEVKLTGCNGNAFSILGRLRDVALKSGWSKSDWERFSSEALSGNYNHLLATAMTYFEVY